jgi:hypothetical protein
MEQGIHAHTSLSSSALRRLMQVLFANSPALSYALWALIKAGLRSASVRAKRTSPGRSAPQTCSSHQRYTRASFLAKRTSTGRSSPYRSLCITLSSSAYFDSHVLLCKIWNIGNYFLRYIVYHNYKFHCVSRVTFLSCRNPGMIYYHIKDGRAVGDSRRNPRLRRGRLVFVCLYPTILWFYRDGSCNFELTGSGCRSLRFRRGQVRSISRVCPVFL